MRMRMPRMQGLPPHFPGSTVMRLSKSESELGADSVMAHYRRCLFSGIMPLGQVSRSRHQPRLPALGLAGQQRPRVADAGEDRGGCAVEGADALRDDVDH